MPSDFLSIGSRVGLRRPTESDGRAFIDLMRASRDFLSPWVHPLQDLHKYPAYLQGFATARNRSFLVCRHSDLVLLGVIEFSEIVRGVFQNAYLGFYIGAPYARQGYMREGLSLALDHAFGPMDLHRLEANLQPENRPSQALVEGLGFRREGFSPRYLKIAGEWRDHERWALLKEEWRRS